MKVDKNITNCLNCNNPFSEGDLYCSNCSQKRTNGLISVKDLFADFFSTIFNIDGKLISTLKDLFIPGKLTTSFFAGHHERYYKPLRMFIFFLVAFFAILGLTLFSSNEIDIDTGGETHEVFTKIQHKNELRKTWENSLAQHRQQYTGKNEQAVINSIASTIDTKILDTKDSMYLRDSKVILNDGSELSKYFSKYKFAVDDLELLENNFGEFAEKYEITDFTEKFLLQQAYRTFTDPNGTIKFVIGNMTWMLIVLIPVIAFILHLLYYRREYFYVQHLTFLFHNHAFVFVAMSLLAILVYFFNLKTHNEIIIVPVLLGINIFLFIAMKRFYGQGFFKTLLKYMIVLLSYVFISLMFFIITILISFAIYS